MATTNTTTSCEREGLACVEACERCIEDCLKTDATGRAACIRACRDCVDACAIAIAFELRASPLAAKARELCKLACEACAKACQDAGCSSCLSACGACATACS